MSSTVDFDLQPSPPKRRWWQFRIKTLLWMMFLSAICVAWWTDRQRLRLDALRHAEEARQLANEAHMQRLIAEEQRAMAQAQARLANAAQVQSLQRAFVAEAQAAAAAAEEKLRQQLKDQQSTNQPVD